MVYTLKKLSQFDSQARFAIYFMVVVAHGLKKTHSLHFHDSVTSDSGVSDLSHAFFMIVCDIKMHVTGLIHLSR